MYEQDKLVVYACRPIGKTLIRNAEWQEFETICDVLNGDFNYFELCMLMVRACCIGRSW